MKLALSLPPLCLCIAVRMFACMCSVQTPCEVYASHHGSPTFVGEAISEETVSDLPEWSTKADHVPLQKVTFHVEEAFEDTPGEMVTVYGRGTTCDIPFKVGTRYLVYGWRGKDGKIRTDRCTRTAPLSDAIEDLMFLRSLPTSVGGKIIGVVRFVTPRDQTGAVGGSVTASGSDGDHKVKVEVPGDYELKGLPIGDYRLTFTPDDSGTEVVQFKVSIPVRGGCAGTGVRLGNATVRGNVADEARAPVPNADVFLFYALDGQYHPENALKTRTDANGRFTFSRVEAAKFILSAQYGGSRKMIFFPGTEDNSKAKIVEILAGRPQSDLTVLVPRESR
jgi:hypothetical protein